MEKLAQVIAVMNQKGGVGKSTTTMALAEAFTEKGKKTLLIDCDPTNSTSTKATVCKVPSQITGALLEDLMYCAANGKSMVHDLEEAIHHTKQGIDVIPTSRALNGVVLGLNGRMDDMKFMCLKKIVSELRDRYDYILLDAGPDLSILTSNIMAASDRIIPVTQAQDLSEQGVMELLQTITDVRKAINPKLVIQGMLIVMVDNRSKGSKKEAERIEEKYSRMGMKVFNTKIPRAIDAERYAAKASLPISSDPKGKVAEAYRMFAEEVLEG